MTNGYVRTHRLSDEEFQRLKEVIRKELGIKMPETKKVMLESRLQKRLRTLGMGSFTEYLDYVLDTNRSNGELTHMIDTVTTNKTDFFREEDHFTYMYEHILPDLTNRYRYTASNPCRVWSAGCSTGEEAYTIAMVFEDYRKSIGHIEYEITATDVSQKVVRECDKGIYRSDRINFMNLEYKKRYFLKSKDNTSNLVRVKPFLRERVQCFPLNLKMTNKDFYQRFDIVFCRNVLIYFEKQMQDKILSNIFDSVKPEGYVILGHSEPLLQAGFPVKTMASTIYQKLEGEVR